mmetsp:Transcript_65983/g.124824  ORF Transcript_65983/g.124824 Transcript_65983/m.124824 type:complete len:315 (+) Transcript_65983:751-1695(+)
MRPHEIRSCGGTFRNLPRLSSLRRSCLDAIAAQHLRDANSSTHLAERELHAVLRKHPVCCLFLAATNWFLEGIEEADSHTYVACSLGFRVPWPLLTMLNVVKSDLQDVAFCFVFLGILQLAEFKIATANKFLAIEGLGPDADEHGMAVLHVDKKCLVVGATCVRLPRNLCLHDSGILDIALQPDEWTHDVIQRHLVQVEAIQHLYLHAPLPLLDVLLLVHHFLANCLDLDCSSSLLVDRLVHVKHRLPPPGDAIGCLYTQALDEEDLNLSHDVFVPCRAGQCMGTKAPTLRQRGNSAAPKDLHSNDLQRFQHHD